MRLSARPVFVLSVVLLVVLLLQPVVVLAAGSAPGTAVVPAAASLAGPGQAQGQARANVISSLGNLPLYFIENEGQVDSQVAYYLAGGETEIYFGSGGVTFALSGVPALSPTPAGEELPATTVRYGLRLGFLGASAARPVGVEKTETVVSYFEGGPEQWHTGLSTYSRIAYPDLWPGIDLVYYGSGGELKYEFVVHPGADPTQIRLAYRGAAALRVDEAGQLQVVTPVQTISDAAPVAYQEVDRERRGVAAAYALDEEMAAPEAFAYGFQVGPYDPSLPLVIDPALDLGLFYSGFLGGSNDDYGYGIAVDSSGNAYVVGYTASSDFPAQVGPDTTYNDDGGHDAFVAKVKADGTGLVYLGFLGGSEDEAGYGIAVDSAGNAYVAGLTGSSNFPAVVGPDTSHNLGADAFVAKVNADGTGLVYSGFLGGSGSDHAAAIAVDSDGCAYVTGLTDSSGFPAVVGPDLGYNGGEYDAFVAKVKADGTGLVYAGFLGGSERDRGYGIAVDSSGNAYVAGFTDSINFPAVVGPYLSLGAAGDAFVAKVNADGTGLVYSGFLGGSSEDEGYGIAVDSAGNAYVTGLTTSSGFPTLIGPDTTHNGMADAFVAKVKADGTGLLYSGFLGGSQDEAGYGIAVDSAGNAYITGLTTSSGFPTLIGPDTTFSGAMDAFVTKLEADGTGLVYSGFLGGSSSSWEYGRGIAVDRFGNAYVTGQTTSDDFPTQTGPDTTYNDDGDGDVFVAKFGQKSFGATGTVRDSSGQPLAGVVISDGAGHSATTGADGTYDLSGLPAGTYTFTASKSGYTFSPGSLPVTVPPDASGQDFTGTRVYVISGTVRDSSGQPLDGVVVSDGAGHSATSGADGTYTLQSLPAGTYTFTASKSGYTFSPGSVAVTVPPDASGQDFTGTRVYVISGTVRDSSGQPLAGVVISDGAGHSATTGADGTYTLQSLVAGTYTFTASKSGYTFSPGSVTVTVPPDASGQDFTGTGFLYLPCVL